jgi:MoxR-like ATPase
MIYNQQRNEFIVRKGPIFANFILADEINRAPAKVQSALLEAMQERQVTIGDTTYKLDEPFLVLATQNPLEQEGTYPLPEAQVDRFLMKVVVGYPTRQEEQLIIRQNVQGLGYPTVNQVVSVSEILTARQMVRDVYMDEKVEQYILDIVFATRNPGEYKLDNLKPLISYGSSPRGSINLAVAAKAQAFLNKRGYVIPEDVRSICNDVLRHRIGLTYEAEAENVSILEILDQIIQKINLP